MISALLERIRRSQQHTSLYHFTDRRNLASIQAHGGILSMAALKKRSITVPAPGGNEWSLDADLMCGMDAYVHLCFTRGHPMRYIAERENRIVDTVWLRIDPSILELPGVMITDDVSNKSGVVPKWWRKRWQRSILRSFTHGPTERTLPSSDGLIPQTNTK